MSKTNVDQSIEDAESAIAKFMRKSVDKAVLKILGEDIGIEKIIRDAVEATKIVPREVHFTFNGTFGGKIDSGEIQHEALERTLSLLSIGQPTFLVGPRGSGKTTIAAHAAQALGVPLTVIAMSGGVTESALLGRYTINGTFLEGPLTRAWTKPGVLLIDEIDAADSNVMVGLNAAIEQGILGVPTGNLQKHKDLRIIVAANTWGTGPTREYCGRNALDGAFLDRFCASRIFVGYDKNLERKIIDPDVLHFGERLRDAVERNGLRRTVSTRVLLRLSEQRKHLGWGSEKWKASVLADWSEDDKTIVVPQLPYCDDKVVVTKSESEEVIEDGM